MHRGASGRPYPSDGRVPVNCDWAGGTGGSPCPASFGSRRVQSLPPCCGCFSLSPYFGSRVGSLHQRVESAT
ncbi:hypothetical protein I3J09_28210 (plasmid) [Streptomyces clavuligerus]|nr:hypothetical protein [Streptomyces clavuligerus]ANW22613.1 hypothetical protein BB341_30370 [Streptomyces clavuligerus]AXU16918.1 hypothetical protein D1794_29640 [Streptomyces clavuligerus]EDY53358.1 hypothetical protein SSCG_06386 [Streptomyces clavuligerus]MBY6306807.1 hypothetical protein [Streptomyces clavuligerus]QCS10593.1 hypothetical protein CRV15_34245 [Streptomyces clavuligerus]